MGKSKANKFVNPTDQTRKFERKRELKKNKKQRFAVRTAVIRGRDPDQIIAELERLDQIEFNVGQSPILNESVLNNKRRKLQETWDRMLRFHQNEDKETYAQLKRMEADYASKRNELRKHYEAVKSAENVNLDEIPLPALPDGPPPEPAVIRIPLVLTSHRPVPNKEPPGPPPGPPPGLGEINDDKFKTNKEREVDEFLKEIESFVPPASVAATVPPIWRPQVMHPRQPISPPAAEQPFVPPHPSFRPSFVPGLRPPQNLLRLQHHPSRVPNPHQTRPPIPPPSRASLTDKNKPVTTIEAKPQLRNLSADATRFIPSSLRVKRPEKQHSSKPKPATVLRPTTSSSTGAETKQLKDEAYEQFMEELQGLL